MTGAHGLPSGAGVARGRVQPAVRYPGVPEGGCSESITDATDGAAPLSAVSAAPRASSTAVTTEAITVPTAAGPMGKAGVGVGSPLASGSGSPLGSEPPLGWGSQTGWGVRSGWGSGRSPPREVPARAPR
jgi:hypothetical protein